MGLLEEVPLELGVWDSFLQEAFIGSMCLCAVLGHTVTVLSNSNELGPAPRRFWGSGLLGRENFKSKGSEAENGLSLATGKREEVRLGSPGMGAA